MNEEVTTAIWEMQNVGKGGGGKRDLIHTFHLKEAVCVNSDNVKYPTVRGAAASD